MSKLSGDEWVRIYDRAAWLPDRTKSAEVMGHTLTLVAVFKTDHSAPMGRYDTKYDGKIQKDRATFVQGDIVISASFRGNTTEILFRRIERLQFDRNYKQIYTQSRTGYGIYVHDATFGLDTIPDEDLTFIKLVLL